MRLQFGIFSLSRQHKRQLECKCVPTQVSTTHLPYVEPSYSSAKGWNQYPADDDCYASRRASRIFVVWEALAGRWQLWVGKFPEESGKSE